MRRRTKEQDIAEFKQLKKIKNKTNKIYTRMWCLKNRERINKYKSEVYKKQKQEALKTIDDFINELHNKKKHKDKNKEIRFKNEITKKKNSRDLNITSKHYNIKKRRVQTMNYINHKIKKLHHNSRDYLTDDELQEGILFGSKKKHR